MHRELFGDSRKLRCWFFFHFEILCKYTCIVVFSVIYLTIYLEVVLSKFTQTFISFHFFDVNSGQDIWFYNIMCFTCSKIINWLDKLVCGESNCIITVPKPLSKVVFKQLNVSHFCMVSTWKYLTLWQQIVYFYE